MAETEAIREDHSANEFQEGAIFTDRFGNILRVYSYENSTCGRAIRFLAHTFDGQSYFTKDSLTEHPMLTYHCSNYLFAEEIFREFIKEWTPVSAPDANQNGPDQLMPLK